MSSLVSADDLVRSLLKYLNQPAFFRQVSEEIIGLGPEDFDALATCRQLGGEKAVAERLRATIGDKFPEGFFFPDIWVRIPPKSPRMTHNLCGRVYNRGQWYSITKESDEALAVMNEPLHDGQPDGPRLFEVKKTPPKGLEP